MFSRTGSKRCLQAFFRVWNLTGGQEHKNSTRLLTFKTGSLNPIDAFYPDFLALTWDDEGDEGEFFSPPRFGTIPAMDVTDLNDRIWYGLRDTLRMSYYYSDLSRSLRTRYLTINFFSLLAPAIAIVIIQTGWHYRDWAVTFLLFLVSAAQGYVLHFNLASDVTASRIMGNQFDKLAEKWRLLWICKDQDRKGIERWIEHLEDVTNHLTIEFLESYRDDLNEIAEEEAIHDLKTQFGKKAP